MDAQAIVHRAHQVVPAFLNEDEKLKLAELALEVNHAGALIAEIGVLYGGSTAIICLSAPLAKVYCFDNFSWWVKECGQASEQRFKENLARLGISNVRLIIGDSRLTGRGWQAGLIDLLWIDGLHELPGISADLANFGRYARTIAIHDYGKMGNWPAIERATTDYLQKHPEFRFDSLTNSLAVLRRL